MRLIAIERRHFVILGLLAAAPLASAAGCGGSSSSTTGPGGSSSSGTTTSTTTTGTGGTATTSSTSTGTGGVTTSTSSTGTGGTTTSSSGTGGMPGNGCTGANGSACNDNGVNGLCEGMMCSTCNDPTDDATCAAAYPPMALCLAGVCTPGNCRTDANCPTGEICGATQTNFCGKCTGDAQCHGDPTYGANTICETAAGATQGTCVTNACTTNDKVCAANAKDFCCAAKCVPGNCCVTADCTVNGQTCKNNRCTACPPVTNNTYYVDPVGGDDGAGNGSSATGGACAFQTISRALEVIGPTPGAGTKIELLNTGPAGAAETFPITVPGNILIEGAVAGTPSTVNVPANVLGFTLAAAASGLNNLILDGTLQAGNNGVQAQTGATATTTITDVEVRNMANGGISAFGTATLALGTGVSVHTIGTAANPHDGLGVFDNAKVTITVNTGGTAATFNTNSSHGILVEGAGSVTIGGTLNPAAKASGNVFAGLYILQTPGNAVPMNTVSNFQANDSTDGNGITVHGGSALTLRTSQTQGNKFNGIWVATYVNGTTKSDSVALIDLGTAASAGGNTFQYAVGAQPNGDSGICLQLTANAGQVLNAAGNKFEAANCAATAVTLNHTANACAAGSDYGIIGAPTTNTIVLTKCM